MLSLLLLLLLLSLIIMIIPNNDNMIIIIIMIIIVMIIIIILLLVVVLVTIQLQHGKEEIFSDNIFHKITNTKLLHFVFQQIYFFLLSKNYYFIHWSINGLHILAHCTIFLHNFCTISMVLSSREMLDSTSFIFLIFFSQ